MRIEEALKATELSSEMLAVVEQEMHEGMITPLSVAAWIVEANFAQAELDAIPWDALRGPETFDNSAAIGAWVREHGPKEEDSG
jgi:hypothetical protein